MIVGAEHGQRDRVLILVDGSGRPSSTQLHRWQGVCHRLEYRLEVGLVEPVDVRPAGLCRSVPVDRAKDLTFPIAKLGATPFSARRCEQIGMLTHDPGRLQDTKSLVVDRARPWHRIARRPFLDDCHLPSLTSEENCRHETNRARAHDEEVDQAGGLIKVWCIHRTTIFLPTQGSVLASLRAYGFTMRNST